MNQGLRPAFDGLFDAMTRAGVPAAPALRPGLAADAVTAAAAASFPHPLPDQLVALHAWRDGTDWAALGNGAPDIAPYGAYLSIAEAVAAYGRSRELAASLARGLSMPAESVWSSRWLPLFDCGDGDMVVVVCGPGEAEGAVWRINHEESEGTMELHRDVAEMVSFLTRAYAGGAVRVRTVAGFRQLEDDRRALAAIRRAVSPVAESQLREWVAAIGHSRAAFLHLQLLLPPEVVPDLLDVLGGGSDTARSHAALLLGDIGDAAAGPALRAVLEDPVVAEPARRALDALRT